MPDITDTENVPLNLWPCPTGDGAALRHHLATRAVGAYSPPGGTVIDLTPGQGEVLAASTSAGRNAIVLPRSPSQRRRRLAALAHLDQKLDLAVALPPTPLTPTRTHDCSLRAAAVLAARVLRPSGYLVAALTPTGGGTDPVSAAVAVVTAHGFAYFQHVVVLVGVGADGGPPDDGRPLTRINVLVFCRTTA